VRWNTSFAYLDPARGRPNLTILGDTLVDRIDAERRLVHTDGPTLSAGTIVLAAGAYGSPGILLRSGVGPALAHDLPVGEALADHVGVGVGWEPTPLLQEETARFEAAHPLFMAQVTVRLGDLFLFPALDPGYELSAAAFFMKPFSRGRVRLNGADPRTPLAIEHGFLADERDVAPLVEGVDTLRALTADEPLRRHVAGELRPGGAVAAEDHVRAAARGFFHPVGTCAIGAVVDAHGRVLGLEDVVVADASIMPTIPRANTNLTAVAIGERVAGWLAQAK
jgi:choline dehydrogenase